MLKLCWIDSEGDDQSWDFPHRFILCGSCEGEGCFYGSPHAGVESTYRETCDCCNGLRVTKVVDDRNLDEEDKEKYKEYLTDQKRNAAFLREWQSEARHGA